MRNCKFCENSILVDTYGWGEVVVCKKCNSYFSIIDEILYFCGIELGDNGFDYIAIEKFNDKIIIVLNQTNKFFDFKTELKISDYPEDIDKLNLLKSFYKNLEFV